jgi:hypothetical protein
MLVNLIIVKMVEKMVLEMSLIYALVCSLRPNAGSEDTLRFIIFATPLL